MKKVKEVVHGFLDWLGFPRLSAKGLNMPGVMQRLTFGWFWTDSPKLAKDDQEQDRLEDQLNYEEWRRREKRKPSKISFGPD